MKNIKQGDVVTIVDLNGLVSFNAYQERNGGSYYSPETLSRLFGHPLRMVDSRPWGGTDVQFWCDATNEPAWFTSDELVQFFKYLEKKPESAPVESEPTLKCEELIDITPILDVATAAPERTEHFVLAKLQEESGELARAVNQPDRVDEAVSGEVADVILTVVDLLFLNLQNDPRFANVHPSDLRCITVDLINEQIAKKTAKWAKAVL